MNAETRTTTTTERRRADIFREICREIRRAEKAADERRRRDYKPAHTRRTSTACGSAYGGNYNKESAAIADALNEIPAALKLIYDQRENDIKIYGTALYNAAPKYERGTDVNQIRTILEAANIILISHDETKTTDHYYFERSENNEKDDQSND